MQAHAAAAAAAAAAVVACCCCFGTTIASDERRIARSSVETVYHAAPDQQLYMGLDPYEERLLIALLGGGAALLFALVFLIICCRKYRIDRGGGKERMWNPQMYAQPGRPAYYPTGYQPQMTMDPAVLDPARAYGQGGPPSSNRSYPGGVIPQQQYQQQQQQYQQQYQQQMVDNTAYASLPSHSQQV